MAKQITVLPAAPVYLEMERLTGLAPGCQIDPKPASHSGGFIGLGIERVAAGERVGASVASLSDDLGVDPITSGQRWGLGRGWFGRRYRFRQGLILTPGGAIWPRP